MKVESTQSRDLGDLCAELSLQSLHASFKSRQFLAGPTLHVRPTKARLAMSSANDALVVINPQNRTLANFFEIILTDACATSGMDLPD